MNASEVPESPTSVVPKVRHKGVVKMLARVAIALGLLAVMFGFFVSWNDQLKWPSRFGGAALVGRYVMTGASSGQRARFTVAEGSHQGLELEFIGDAGAWTAVIERAPGSAEQRIDLDAQQAKELKSQPEAGLKSTASRLADAPLALVEAFVLYLLAAVISFQRWQVLLHAVHVDARFWRAQKLGFIGLFWSNVIPGMTGGDLAKAIMVARDHPEQRPAAVLSVIVDRAIGLLGLAFVAAGALHFQHGHFAQMERNLDLLLVAILLGAAVVLSRRLRKLARLDKLLSLLPFADVLKKLDRSALLYREARWQLVYSVGVSLVIHGMIMTSFAVLGRALGLNIPFVDYYALAPLGLIAQSLPITPGGVGVGEGAFISLFSMAGVSASAALALSVSYRFVQFTNSLIGGLLMLTRHELPPSAREMDASEQEDGAPAK